MKESPDPLLLRDAIKSLGNALRAEQKTAFANTSQPTGLDAFIDDWLCDYPGVAQYGPLTVVVTALRGYDTFSVHKRELRGEAGLRALLALYNSTINASEADSPPTPRSSSVKTASPPEPITPNPAPKSATAKTKKSPAAAAPSGAKPVTLASALEVVPGVGLSSAKAFRRLGVRTVRDILYHFPFRYEDRSNRQTIADMRPGETYSVVGTIVDSRTFTMRAGGSGLEFKIEDDTGILKLSFFRQPWLAKQLKIGATIMVSGKVEHFNGMRQMTGPDWQFYQGENAEDLLHVGRLVPFHPLTEGLVEKGGREIIKKLVDGYAGQLADPLPAEVRARAHLLDLPTSIRLKHFPPSEDAILRADQRLGFDEFLCIQLGVLQRKMVSQHEQSLPIPYDDAVHSAFLHKLPFALTNAYPAGATTMGSSWRSNIGNVLGLNHHNDTAIDALFYAGQAAANKAVAKIKYQEATARLQSEGIMGAVSNNYYTFFTNNKKGIAGIGALQLVKGKTQRVVTNWGIDWTGVYKKA